MFPMAMPLIMGAVSMAGGVMQGMGAKQASAKQARLQMIADNEARRLNNETLAVVNEARERLGRELLTVPEESWVNTDAMMAAAERSGFNPVTWLNAGGMQAYQVRMGHNAADAYKMMVPEYALAQASQVPQQHSALSGWGAGLSAGAQAFATQYRAEQSYDLQSAKILAGMGMGGMNSGMGLSMGNGLMSALSAGSRTEESAGGQLSGLPYPASWKPGKVEVTNPSYYGVVSPDVADAGGAYQQRYGEPGEWIFGAATMFDDAVRNITGRSLGEWGRYNGASLAPYRQAGDVGVLPALTRWWNDSAAWRLPGFGGASNPGYFPFPGSSAY